MKTTTSSTTTEITFASVLAEADKAQAVISGKQDSVAQHLLQIAQALTTAEQFEAGCAAAEVQRRARMTEKAAEKGLTKKQRQAFVRLPASWSNAKSVLLRGWEDFQLIPNDYESYSQYKEAKTAAVKARNALPKTGATVATPPAGMESAPLDSAKQVTTVLFSDLIARVSRLPREVQEEISLHFEELIAKYEPAQTGLEEGDTDPSTMEEGAEDTTDEDLYILEQAQQQQASQ